MNTRSCITIGLRKQAAIAESVESQLCSMRLGPLQSKVKSSGYGKCPPDKMFKPRTNKKKCPGSRNESARSFFQKSPSDSRTDSSKSSHASNGSTRATWNILPQQQSSKTIKFFGEKGISQATTICVYTAQKPFVIKNHFFCTS